MRERTPLTLRAGARAPRRRAFAGLELDVDVKLPGYEQRVVQALREHGLVERTLVSGMYTDALARIRAAEPGLRLGWSVPRVRRDYTTDMLTAIPALAILTGYRAMLPRPRAQRPARGALRRDHGALARRHARARARGARRRRRAVRVDGRRRARASPSSTRWASTASSPTTRGCSERTRQARGALAASASAQPIRQLAALKPGGSEPARLLRPARRRRARSARAPSCRGATES